MSARTHFRNLLFFTAVILASSSCHLPGPPVAAVSKPKGFHGPVAQRVDTISAAKSHEEETFIKGCTQKSLGNNAQAIVYFQECLVMNPNNAAADYELAKIYLGNGKEDRALPFAKNAATLSPGNRWFVLLYAQVLEKNGNYSEAEKLYKQLSDQEPQNSELLYHYAALLLKSGNTDDALKIYDRIETIDGISDSLVNDRIAIYQNKNDKTGQENELKKLVTNYPSEIKYWTLLRTFYEKNNHAGNATATNQKMISLFPGAVEPKLVTMKYNLKSGLPPYKDVASVFAMPGDVDAKIDFLKTVYAIPLSLDPQIKTDRVRDADSLCSILRKLDPGNKEVLLISANYFLYNSDPGPARARDLYRQALDLDKNQYDVWKNILQIDFYLNDTISEVKDCQSVIDLFPSQPDAYYYLGQIQYARKDFRHAIGNLEMANDYAMDSTTRFGKISPLLVKAYYANGDYTKGDNLCMKIIGMNNSAWNGDFTDLYCASLADQNKDLDKAEKMMLDVVQKYPKDIIYAATLAWIEYRQKNFTAAEDRMKKVLQVFPVDPKLYERMGDIQFRLGKKDEAMKSWKMAKDKGDTNPALDRKMKSGAMNDDE